MTRRMERGRRREEKQEGRGIGHRERWRERLVDSGICAVLCIAAPFALSALNVFCRAG